MFLEIQELYSPSTLQCHNIIIDKELVDCIVVESVIRFVLTFIK